MISCSLIKKPRKLLRCRFQIYTPPLPQFIHTTISIILLPFHQRNYSSAVLGPRNDVTRAVVNSYTNGCRYCNHMAHVHQWETRCLINSRKFLTSVEKLFINSRHFELLGPCGNLDILHQITVILLLLMTIFCIISELMCFVLSSAVIVY